MELIFVVPISTAACEQGFSCMNRIKTTYRTQLREKVLDNLMMIKRSGGPIDGYYPMKAIKLWWQNTDDGKVRHYSYKR